MPSLKETSLSSKGGYIDYKGKRSEIFKPIKTQNTPILNYCEDGDSSSVIFLVKGGAPVNEQNSLGTSPLHWAASNGMVSQEAPKTRRSNNLNGGIKYK